MEPAVLRRSTVPPLEIAESITTELFNDNSHSIVLRCLRSYDICDVPRLWIRLFCLDEVESQQKYYCPREAITRYWL